MEVKIVVKDELTRSRALMQIERLNLEAGGVTVTISSLDTRTIEQNDLADISEQVEYHGHRLSAADWKDLLTASLHRHRMVPEIDGPGMVLLGLSTSRMTKSEMTELLDRIEVFGVENNVKFRAPKHGY